VFPYVPAPPFSPADLPGLVSWYNASALRLADGDPVDEWPDSSPSAYLLSKAAPLAPSPVFAASDPLLGGKPSVQFSRGVGPRSCSALSLVLPLAGSLLPMINAPRTVYAVGYLTAPDSIGAQGCFGYGVDTTVAKLQFSKVGSGAFGVDFGFLLSGSGPLLAGGGFVACLPYLGDIAASPFYLSGAELPSVPVNAIRTGTDGGGVFLIVMGAGVTYSASPEILANWGGAVAETLIYDSAHDAATRAIVTNYLAAKYAIALTP
jgi:hypothetical protein